MKNKGHHQQILYSTILGPAPSSQKQQLPPAHPLYYCNNRKDYLSNLSQQYSTESRLPTMDLKRNVKVGYYMGKYQKAKQQLEKREKIKKSYLKSDDFQTIFLQQIDRNRNEARQKRERQKLRQQMENLYMQEQINHEQPQHDQNEGQCSSSSQNQYKTVLSDYRTDPMKQKELYLIDLELGKLQFQQKISKKIENKQVMCQNQELMSKMSKNILSAYMVNFDQIYSLLIDEILTQEVIYLNYIEAQYKVQKCQEYRTQQQDRPKYQIQYQNTKTLEMIQLVKGLDDLGDDHRYEAY